MRRWVVAFGIAALVLTVTPAGGGSASPLHLGAPRAQATRPVAFVWRKDGERLAALNPRTLRTGKQRTPTLGAIGAWAFEHPDGSVVAISAAPVRRNSPLASDAIRFVDVNNLGVQPDAVPIDGRAQALFWGRPDRLVGVVAPTDAENLVLETIDPSVRRVLSTTPLWGDVFRIGRFDEGLVLLQTPHNGIGPARLAVVGETGSVRSTPLDRISAGATRVLDAQGNLTGEKRIPALAIDPTGDRAYVVQPDGPAAAIDLRTLGVTYHDLTAPRSILSRLSAWLTPPAEAKESTGPERRGTWLGDGLIAITGSADSHVDKANGGVQFNTAAAGLAIVDTHDWTVRMLDPRADSVSVTDGLLLTTAVYSNAPHGMGLAAYGRDRKLKFSLFSPWMVWVETALAGRAYVGTYNVYGVAGYAIVDLATGRIIGKRHGLLPVPALSDGPG
jgi:hypothetical protein